MANKTILNALSSAAGAAGGAGLNVEEVFSTYLYAGNNSSQTITNGIDLAGEGGVIWIKQRTGENSHYLHDTEMSGSADYLRVNSPAGKATDGIALTKNSDGFTIGSTTWDGLNASGHDYVSWVWRKAPRFFDIVSYTGDGTNDRQIAHNLDAVPGCIVIKMTSGNNDWKVYHRGIDASNPEDYKVHLNETQARTSGTTLFDAPTSTHFVLDSNTDVNENGQTYVAYLFAHNDGDGEFGPNGDADIIKCGAYTGNGSTNGPEIDLGFEPQWVLIKNTTTSGDNWFLYDNMRGVSTGGNDRYIFPSDVNVEAQFEALEFNSTGFKIKATLSGLNTNNDNYIYIAIRRGPMGIPESASEVFDVNLKTGSEISSGLFVANSMLYTDMALSDGRLDTSGSWISDRLRSKKYNFIPTTSAEATDTAGTNIEYDHQYGMKPWFASGTDSVFWAWKRAPSFFDVVAYTGNGVYQRTIAHNLGVAPEMMWVKKRNSSGTYWCVYHKDLDISGYGSQYVGNGYTLYLHDTSAQQFVSYWGYTDPTDTIVTLGNDTHVNASGDTYIAYLFASLAGVSKVGSFTTTGGAVNVDCGFSSGARFVLLKAASGTDANLYNWELYDTERGIVSGNDPVLFLNSTSAEYTGGDYIDPYSSGFTFNSGAGGRPSGQTIIFYAIA